MKHSSFWRGGHILITLKPEKLSTRPPDSRLKKCRPCTLPNPYQPALPLDCETPNNHCPPPPAMCEHSFKGSSPLWPPFAWQSNKAVFPPSPKTLSLKIQLGASAQRLGFGNNLFLDLYSIGITIYTLSDVFGRNCLSPLFSVTHDTYGKKGVWHCNGHYQIFLCIVRLNLKLNADELGDHSRQTFQIPWGKNRRFLNSGF